MADAVAVEQEAVRLSWADCAGLELLLSWLSLMESQEWNVRIGRE